MYRITSITKDGVQRTDGRYPSRVGSVVEILSLDIGKPMELQYVLDANGNEKTSYLYTGKIVKIESEIGLNKIVVTTSNSVYTLERFAH